MLGLAVAVGVERAAIMAEPIPLRGELQIEDDAIVVDDVGAAFHRPIVHGPSVRHVGRFERRRIAAEEELLARIVERQAEQERMAFPRLRDRGAAPFRRDQIHPSDPIVIAELAPLGAFRLLQPSSHPGHLPLPSPPLPCDRANLAPRTENDMA